MGILRDLAKTARPEQWYKNLIAFVALIFAAEFTDLNAVFLAFAGFAALCLVSSANYVFNDIMDVKRDKENPEKKKRPLASGSMGIGVAWLFFLLLLFAGLGAAFLINMLFFYACAFLFVSSTLYSLCFKKILFLDIISISVNFVIRAVAGAAAISVLISAWLVIGIFFFAMFLATAKRHGELEMLQENSHRHRETLRHYDKGLMFSLMNIFMAVLFMVFALYSLSSKYSLMIWLMPFFVFIVLRAYYIMVNNPSAAAKPHRLMKDRGLLVSGIFFLAGLMAVVIL